MTESNGIAPVKRKNLWFQVSALILATLMAIVIGFAAGAWLLDRDEDVLNAACKNYDTLHVLITDTPTTSDEVLRALGFDDASIALLRKEGMNARLEQLRILGKRPNCGYPPKY